MQEELFFQSNHWVSELFLAISQSWLDSLSEHLYSLAHATEIHSRETHGGIALLVLTGKPGRSIRIGDNIIVTVIETSSERCKLGFEAPLDMRIVRDNAKDQEPKDRTDERQ